MHKGALGLLVALCIALGAATEQWKNLHVKWDLLTEGYYELPTTLTDAEAQGFVYMIHDGYLKADLYSFQGDPNLAIIFDSYGNIAGLRFGYIASEVVQQAESKNLTFPAYFDDKKMYGSTTYWGVDVYINTVLFIDPATLKAGGRSETGGLVADDVYIKLFGTWTKMPKDASDALALNFTKQGCFFGIGTHYFLGMTEDADCSELQGVFLLYSTSNEMIGLGLAPWGSFGQAKANYTWFETLTALETEVVIPSQPDCLSDYINDYGTSAIHIFFRARPRITMCHIL